MNPYIDISRGVETVSIPADQSIDLVDITDFVYVRYNIPGTGASSGLFEDAFEGCRCDGNRLCDDFCQCISRFGRMYDECGRLTNFDPYSQKMKPIYECNKSCVCQPSCQNRVVQHGVHAELMVFPTEKKGLGVKCTEDIERNAFVCEYAGEIISLEVAKSRTKARADGEPNYILTVSEHTADGVLVTYVDPTLIGNVGRFINHSCEPNLYMVPVRIDNDVPHLALFAIRDIKAGEEICYDYSGSIQQTDAGGKTVQDLQQSSNRVTDKRECHCGSAACRLFLPFEESLYAV